MPRPAHAERIKDGAQTVSRALAILECFTAGEPSRSVTQISSRVRLTVPTVYRLLKALESKDMVVRDAVSRRYSLGPGVMRLARVIMQRDDLQAIVLPHLLALRERTGETVGLHWLVGHERVCVVELVSPQPIRMASGVGQVYPIYAGAAGKALLAWLAPAEADPFLEKVHFRALTPDTPTTRKAVRSELPRIRRRGFATSVGETVSGASALAAPILDSGGRPVAAINITGPKDRWTPARMAETVEALLDATSQIMRQLGHQGTVAPEAPSVAVTRPKERVK